MLLRALHQSVYTLHFLLYHKQIKSNLIEMNQKEIGEKNVVSQIELKAIVCIVMIN